MDIINNVTNDRTSSSKRLIFKYIKIPKKNFELKQKYSFKMIKEKENSVKKGLLEKIKRSKNNFDGKILKISDRGEKHFMKKILQMKKEMNKNDLSNNSERVEIHENINDHMLKKIGTELKQSLIQLKHESGFEIPIIKSIRTKKTKTTFVNSPKTSSKSRNNNDNKSIDTFLKANEKYIDKSNNLDEDLSFGKLLIDNKSSKLELINNEEKKYNIQNHITKNENEIKSVFTNKSIRRVKTIISNGFIIKRPINEKYRKLMITGALYDSFDDEEEEFEDQINKEFFIMPNSLFIIILDILIAFDIFYCLTYHPYYIASSTMFVFSNLFSFYEVYHFFMEIVYFIDFLVQFVRAYYDFDENLVTAKKKIILHYLESWFLIDLITIIPTFSIIKLYYEKEKYLKGYDYTCDYGCKADNIMDLLIFIKVIKIFKIFSRNQNKCISFIWSYLSNTSFIDNWGKIIFHVVLALFCLHITACFHIIIGRNTYPNWITEHNLSTSNFGSIYVTSIYFLMATMTSVGYGDITGNSIKERIFQIFLLIIGIIAYSWLVSSVSNYVIEKNKDNIFYDSKVKILDEIKLTHPEMDNDLYIKIHLYLKQLKLLHKKKDKNILLDNLPYNIRNSLLYEINRPLIEGLNFFKNFQNSVFILSAVTKLIPIVTNKGDIIIEQNEIINSMVFVKQGRLAVELAIDMNNIYNEIDNYINGNFILGERKEKMEKKTIELLGNFRRKNTFSLMSTLTYTMDDSFNLNKGRKMDLNYKNPVSFRKRLLKLMEKRIGTNLEESKKIPEKKIKYVKLYYIRKGEHFGEIFMFLNKPSAFSLRVKSPKAELLLLKKIDAIEISSNYPHIWKRVNKKSFKNLIHLKELVSREMIKFCEKNGIKYNLSYKKSDVKRSNSTPNIEKLEKNKEITNNLSKKFQQFKRNNKINKEKNIIKNKSKKKSQNKKNLKKKNSEPLKNEKGEDLQIQSTKLLQNENKNRSILKLSESEYNSSNLIPYKEEEVNDELYIGEEYIQNKNNDINLKNNENNYINEKIPFYLLKYNEFNDNNFDYDKKNKNINKLIDSSRRKKDSKIFYHKKKKNIYKNKTNFNILYNINNAFNINQIKNNKKFCSNKLTISRNISFNINKIYDNLNTISKGNYKKDTGLQRKIKTLIQNKYSTINMHKMNNNNIRTNLTRKFSKKEIRFSKLLTPKNTFVKENSKVFSLIKENDSKNEQQKKQKRKSCEIMKEANKDNKSEKDGSNAMLNKITQNIIDGDKNLNNPQIFYNELFTNIIHNKNTYFSTKMVIKNIQIQNSSINRGNEEKKISKKGSVLFSMPKNLLK